MPRPDKKCLAASKVDYVVHLSLFIQKHDLSFYVNVVVVAVVVDFCIK